MEIFQERKFPLICSFVMLNCITISWHNKLRLCWCYTNCSYLTLYWRIVKTDRLMMFGSSALAAAIPIVAFLTSNSSSPITRRGAGLLIEGPKMLMQRQVGSMMSWIERSVEQLPSFPALHPQECVKRSVCEAHLMPHRYGALGFALRFLFP